MNLVIVPIHKKGSYQFGTEFYLMLFFHG